MVSLLTLAFALPILLLHVSFPLQAEENTSISPFASSPQVEVRGDISFLTSARTEKLDLYLPKSRKAGEKSPAVLLIHGGGWKEGDKRQAREIEVGMTLAKNGFVAASINYALRSD